MNGERRTHNKVVQLADLGEIEIASDQEIKQVEILKDVELERPSPEIEKDIQENAIMRMQNSTKILEKNRAKKIGAAKRLYDRKIKKTKYNIGDSVLVSHPNLRKV